MGAKSINLDQLRTHLATAKERLAVEKNSILEQNPLKDGFNREEYAFAYVRAERLGMKAINRRLAEIEWLPMQLDAKSEIISENRASMKRWLASSLAGMPGADEFGNDFMHALTRCALTHDWDHPEFNKLSGRIANLFRDLSCLIGIVYYCTWLAENRVEDVKLSEPENLTRTAEEIAIMMQSPEIYKYLKAPEQDDSKRIRAKKPVAKKAEEPAKKRPILRVIKNEGYLDPFAPEPAPAT